MGGGLEQFTWKEIFCYNFKCLQGNFLYNYTYVEYGGTYTNSIRVSNLPPDVIEEELREYFERRQEQGGGPVKYLSMSSQTGEAVVSFRDSRGKVVFVKA